MVGMSSKPSERHWFVPRMLVGPLLAVCMLVLLIGGVATLLWASYGRLARADSPT